MPQAILAACLLATAVLAIVYGRSIVATVATMPARRVVPRSPADEAQRLLALRYARGELTLDEYRRMVAIIRR